MKYTASSEVENTFTTTLEIKIDHEPEEITELMDAYLDYDDKPWNPLESNAFVNYLKADGQIRLSELAMNVKVVSKLTNSCRTVMCVTQHE